MRPRRPGINACVLPSWLLSCGSLLKLKKLDVYFIGSLHYTPVLVVWFCKVQSKYIVWFCKVQSKRFGVCSFGLSVNLALHICLLHYSTTSRLLPRKLFRRWWSSLSWSDDGDRSSRSIGTGKQGKDSWIFFFENVLSTCFIKEKL